MHLALTDEQAALLVAELDRIIDDDRYPLSPRVKALREIRALLKPYPERPPTPPPPKRYEPPSRGRYKRRKVKGYIRPPATLGPGPPDRVVPRVPSIGSSPTRRSTPLATAPIWR